MTSPNDDLWANQPSSESPGWADDSATSLGGGEWRQEASPPEQSTSPYPAQPTPYGTAQPNPYDPTPPYGTAQPNPYDPTTPYAAGPVTSYDPSGQPYGYGQPPGYGYVVPPPTDGRALAAMIVGIVSMVLACGYGIGLLGSPVALFLGRSAMKKIDRSQGQLGGRGMAQAGFILGIIGTVLLVLFIAVVVAVIVFAINSDPSTA